MLGPVQRGFDRRKIILAVLQQVDLIVWNHANHGRLTLLLSFLVSLPGTLVKSACLTRAVIRLAVWEKRPLFPVSVGGCNVRIFTPR
jgi:hypothetical protein